MIAVQFNPIHTIILSKWLKAYKRELLPNDISPVGFVVYAEEEAPQDNAFCLGFLRLAEGQVAIIDGIIANPDLHGELRHLSIDFLVDTLIESARELGITKLIGWTSNARTFERAMRFGFTPQIGEIVIAKTL